MKTTPVQNQDSEIVKMSFFQRYKWGLIPLLFAMALYINTLHYGFVLDDNMIFQDKNITEGIKGIPSLFSEKTLPEAGNIKPYRPITGVSFAIDYSLFDNGDKANITSKLHLMNILYYSLALFLTFVLALKLFKNQLLALAISLVFAAHPIHTEVVANIKSRDEILAFLFGVLALITFIKFKESKHVKWLYTSIVIYFMAVLSKESAILFIGIFPFIAYYLSEDKTFKGSYILDSKLFLIPAVLYLVLQHSVLGMNLMPKMSELDDMLVGITNPSENLATRIYIVGLYLYKICIPHPLMYDYSINYISKKSFSSMEVWVSLLALISLIFLIFKGIVRKNRIAFGLLFMFLMFTLTCNLFIAIGATFAERFAFTPSLGFAIALVFLFSEIGKKINSKPFILLVLLVPILGLYSFKTITRNKDWVDNDTLFTHDYMESSKSLRVQNNYAAIFYQKAKITADSIEKRKLFVKSIQILEGVTRQYPDYIEAYIQKGISYLEIKNCDNAVKNFEKAKSISKYNYLVESNLGIGYINCGKSEQALDIFRKLLKNDTSLTSFYLRHLGVAHINTNRLDSAEYYFNRIKQEYPNDTEVDPYIKILAEKKNMKLSQPKSQAPIPQQALTKTPPQVFDAATNKMFNDGYQAYQKGDKVKAKNIIENLIKTTPTHALGYAVLGIIAFDNNEFQKSIEYYKKSIALNPTDARIYYNVGNSYLKLNKDAEAIKVFEKCIQQAPTYDKPYKALELYYTSKNNPEKAGYYTDKLKHLK